MADFALVRNAFYFWTNQGVLKHVDGDTWKLLEEKDTSVEAVVSHGSSLRLPAAPDIADDVPK